MPSARLLAHYLEDAASTSHTATVTDAEGLLDSAASNLGRTVSDSLGLTDSNSSTVAAAQYLGGLNVGLGAPGDHTSVLTDVFGLTDQALVAGTFSRSATDAEGLVDTTTSSWVLTRTIEGVLSTHTG